MVKKYILAIDQGTTGSRVILFNHGGHAAFSAYRAIRQIYPNPGWVEHDLYDHVSSVYECAEEVFLRSAILPVQVEAIGNTNQRETTILWVRESGKPLYNAIV